MRPSHALLECLVFFAGTSIAFAQPAEPLSEPLLGPVVPLDANLKQTTAFKQPLTEPLLGPVVPLHVNLKQLDVSRVALNEPLLGPIVPISGTIKLTADGTEPSALTFHTDDAQQHNGIEAKPNFQFGFVPIRVISRPAAAPMVEPNPLALLPISSGDIHPDQIRFQMTTLSEHLADAGLVDEAKRIEEIHQKYVKEHYHRLLLAHKESQFKTLSAEIAELKQPHNAAAEDAQVYLKGRFIELSQDGRNLWKNTFGETLVIETGGEEFLDKLILNGLAKIICEPTATVVSGRNVRFLTGGEIAVPAANGKEGEKNVGTSFQPLGTSVLASPTIIEDNSIQCQLVVEFSQLIAAETDDQSAPHIQTRRVETIIQTANRQSIVLAVDKTPGQNGTNPSEINSTQLIMLRAEIINPADKTTSSEANFPKYVPNPSNRPIIEAKALKDQ